MPYCEGANSAIITISLDGKAAQIRSSAPPVEYTFREVREPGQCFDISYSIFAWFRPNGYTQEYREGCYAFIGRHLSTDVNEYRVTTTYIQSNGTIRTIWRDFLSGTRWVPERGYELLPTFGVPDECGDLQGCELEITDQSGVIWRSSGDTCPSVKIVCEDACCSNQDTLVSIASQIKAKLQKLQ